MGNPSIPQQDPAHELPPAVNGILSYVGGATIAGGSERLPKAAAGQPELLSVVVDAPGMGPVKITYRLNTYRHGRGKFWHWLATHAEKAAG